MTTTTNVGLIGQKFMGKAHSNAWGQAGRFFTLPTVPRLFFVSARDADELAAFADRWGYQKFSTDWHDLIEDPEVDLVDVGTPNDVHAEQAIAALEAGKHVACEKPLAGTLADARAMRDAAKKSKKKTFVWFNYRRCPAVAMARQIVAEGRLGRIFHVRATYLQSWGFADTPLLWRFQKKHAGSGAHGDLNAHIVDMARFITGDDVTEVNGAIAKTFIKERTIPGKKEKGKSDVDDVVLFLATFKSGATASFEASRLAHGSQNAASIEINGEKGSLKFNFEDMNLLHFIDADDRLRERGWRRIMCTSAAGGHPYVAAWWPDAHLIGYEHGFINMVADIIRTLGGEKPEMPLCDFADAYETQRILEAAIVAAKNRAAVKISEIGK